MKPNTSRRGLTLTELLVVVGIIGCLVALLFPSWARAVQWRDRTVCANNLRQLYGGVQGYAADHDGYYPPVDVLSSNQIWCMFITPYLFPSEQATWTAVYHHSFVFSCPANTQNILAATGSRFPFNYGMNYMLSQNNGNTVNRKIQAIPRLAETLLISESGYNASTAAAQLDSYWYPLSAQFKGNYIGGVHSGANNILWCDGHVSSQYDIRSLVPAYGGAPGDRLFLPQP